MNAQVFVLEKDPHALQITLQLHICSYVHVFLSLHSIYFTWRRLTLCCTCALYILVFTLRSTAVYYCGAWIYRHFKISRGEHRYGREVACPASGMFGHSRKSLYSSTETRRIKAARHSQDDLMNCGL